MQQSVYFDLEAERSLISCLLIEPDSILEVLNLRIVGEDFYNQNYRIIYDGILELHKQQNKADYVLIISYLKSIGKIDGLREGEEVGDGVIMNLFQSMASAFNVTAYAKIVKSKSILRKIAFASDKILSTTKKLGMDPLQILADASKEFSLIAQMDRPQKTKTLDKLLIDNLEAITDPNRNEGDILGIATGFKHLDNKIIGMQAGQLIIIAARPAMGKTSLALNIALNSYQIHQKPIVIFSLEMLGHELSLRIISQTSGIPQENIKKKNFDKQDLLNIKSAIKSFYKECKIFINDDSSQNIFNIQNECRRIKNETGDLGLVIVDYIQLMRSVNKENREQQIAEISRGLKLLAKDLECPIIALSQLNRASEARENKRPSLSDLRESGALEQDADIVLLIYRDEFYFPQTTKEKGIAEIIIAKNRSGEMGTIKVMFDGKCTNFHEQFGKLSAVNPYHDFN